MKNSAPLPEGSGSVPRQRRSLPQLGGEIVRVLAAYIGGQFLIALILSFLYGAGFAVLRVPYWFLLGPVCGFLNLVPVFGTPFGLLLVLFATWTGGAELTRVLAVAGYSVAVMTVEGYVLTPRIQGRRLGLRPLVVFAAALAGGVLFGFFGVLLAVPALAVLNVVWRYYRPSARV